MVGGGVGWGGVGGWGGGGGGGGGQVHIGLLHMSSLVKAGRGMHLASSRPQKYLRLRYPIVPTYTIPAQAMWNEHPWPQPQPQPQRGSFTLTLPTHHSLAMRMREGPENSWGVLVRHKMKEKEREKKRERKREREREIERDHSVSSASPSSSPSWETNGRGTRPTSDPSHWRAEQKWDRPLSPSPLSFPSVLFVTPYTTLHGHYYVLCAVAREGAQLI